MSDLKPCPFCGGEVEIEEGMYSSFQEGYAVRCRHCALTFGASGRLGEVYEWSCCYSTEAEAIAAWNTRAQTVFGMTLDEVRQIMKRDAERERTCEMKLTDLSSGSAYHDVWLCCSCGEQVERHTVMGKSEPPNYCPNCGARVTPKNSETTPKVVSE